MKSEEWGCAVNTELLLQKADSSLFILHYLKISSINLSACPHLSMR